MRSCFAGLTIRPIRASALAVFKKKMFLTSLNPGRKLTWVLMLEQLYLRLQLLLPVPAGACYALLRMIELSLYYCGIYDNYVNFSDASREIFPDTFLVPSLLWPFALGGQSLFSSQLPWRMYSIYAQIDLSQFTPYFICHTTSLCEQHWDADCCTRWFGLASNKIAYEEYSV